MDTIPERLLGNEVRRIVDALSQGEYEGVVASCAHSRLTPEDVAEAIEQYGQRLVSPPAEAYTKLDAVQVTNATEPTWSVRAPLYTVSEGKSDLSLELTIVVSSDGTRTELDDIHVL